jgi:hypothetical protein
VPDNTTLWDQNQGNVNANAAARLSSMVSGNDNLSTQPGLVLALFQGNASTEQAAAINQFVGGLNAEVLVRNAAASGKKIPLSDDQKSALSAMGIDYSPVEYTQQNAIAELTAKMAEQGAKPILDPVTGRPKTDAAGNPLVQKVENKPEGGGWFGSVGGFVHHLTNNPVSHFVTHGTFDESSNSAFGIGGAPGGLAPVADEAIGGFNLVNATLSGARQDLTDPMAALNSASQNADLAKALGYDPSSPFSMLAFKAKGYAYNDTSAAASAWADANPNGGVMGWDGDKAVTEAQVYSADPLKYMASITADTTLDPTQVAERTRFVSSTEFQTLVARVIADKQDVGTDFARGVYKVLGQDPATSGPFRTRCFPTSRSLPTRRTSSPASPSTR